MRTLRSLNVQIPFIQSGNVSIISSSLGFWNPSFLPLLNLSYGLKHWLWYSSSTKKICSWNHSHAGFLGSKLVSSLFPNLGDLYASTIPNLNDTTPYRQPIGRLLYLTNTWPNISFLVQQLSHFVAIPTKTHLATAHWILQKINQAPGQGLFFPTANNLKLTSFSN